MEAINSVLSGIFLPALLIFCGIWFAVKLRFFFILHPVRLCNCLMKKSHKGGVSPFRALTVALAGTLGVGNMAGVATAITAGGAGAIFWMWVSALCAMSIKYIEVKLALETRIKSGGAWHGGATYYIRRIIKGKAGWGIGCVFAILCGGNALLTGNVVQVNAACSAAVWVNPLIIGAIVGICGVWVASGGGKRVSGATVAIIPLLSAVYMVLCLAIIFNNISRLPQIFSEIIEGAFSTRSVGGGIGGYVMTRAMRFGVIRGIFSNEAGCGTSPTAHAQADAESPHQQGCFGIFEVFADTIVLCTMTGVVILLCGDSSLDGIPLTLYAFESLAGAWAAKIIAVSINLFAFATVISQSSYGLEAIGFLGGGKWIKRLYLLLIFSASVTGSVISAEIMWQAADLLVSAMTTINVLCLCKYMCGIRGSVPLIQKAQDTKVS